MTSAAPLCRCRCHARVKWNRRTRTWFQFASRDCARRFQGSRNRLSPAALAGVDRYRAALRAQRYGRLVTMLQDVAARRLSLEAALQALVEMDNLTYVRGYNTGLRTRKAAA